MSCPPLKTAVVEAGHWHAPAYFAALEAAGCPAACWSEHDQQARLRRQAEHPGRAYADHSTMIEVERPDLVFAFGVHGEMPQIARDLVTLEVPFSMEKPGGLDPAALQSVVEAAEDLRLFAGADLVMRRYPIFTRLGELRDSGELGRVKAFRFTLLAGGPERYSEWGVDWMLDPERSGGPLFNFGPHGVDLFLWLCGEERAAVLTAAAIGDLHDTRIEDYVAFLLRTPAGALGVFEVGYTMVAGAYKQEMTLISDRLVASSPDGVGGRLAWRAGSAEEQVPSQDGRDSFVAETIQRLREGREPPVPLRQMLNSLRVLTAVAENARRTI